MRFLTKMDLEEMVSKGFVIAPTAVAASIYQKPVQGRTLQSTLGIPRDKKAGDKKNKGVTFVHPR